MTEDGPRFLFSELGPALATAISSARERVVLVAPFITLGGLKPLLKAAREEVAFTVVTRWRVEEIAAGVSDTAVLDVVEARPRSEVLLVADLHAKIYLVDRRIAYFGSANLTAPALGYSSPGNLELLAELEPPPTSLLVNLRRLQRAGAAATKDLQQEFEKAAVSLRTEKKPNRPVHVSLPTPRACPYPFPSFRSPERLYGAYRWLSSTRGAERQELALEDLAVLEMVDERLDEESFRRRVGEALLRQPHLSALDEFVKERRRFGELTDWARRNDVRWKGDHEGCQRYVQTVIRWLLFFLPGRYSLRQARYSEIFGRVEAWQPQRKQVGG